MQAGCPQVPWHPKEQILEPTELFSPDLRHAMVETFGPDGAWLLLSSHWYGWRAHYDLACALVTGARPMLGGDPRPREIGDEFQIVRDLQVQASLFAAADQFATILRATHRHTVGDESFFEAYVGAPVQMADLVRDAAHIDRVHHQAPLLKDLQPQPPDRKP